MQPRLTVRYANGHTQSPEYTVRPDQLVQALTTRPDWGRFTLGCWVANDCLEYAQGAWVCRVYGDHATLWDLKGTLDAALVDARRPA